LAAETRADEGDKFLKALKKYVGGKFWLESYDTTLQSMKVCYAQLVPLPHHLKMMKIDKDLHFLDKQS